MASKGGKIFISYRREDAADAAGRIRDWLVQTQRVARDDVFMDVTNLLPGTDFIQAIEQTISQCRSMIIVISPSWLAQVNTPTASHVRSEAESALRNNLLIIPVLVGGVQMPPPEQLPESIRELTRRNARLVRPDSFDYDMGWVKRALGFQAPIRAGWITAVSAILLVALSLGILSQAPSSKANPVWAFAHPAHPAPPTTTGVAGGNGATTSTPMFRADWSHGLGAWVGSSDWSASNGNLLNNGTNAGNLYTSPSLLAPYALRDVANYAIQAKIKVISDGYDPGFGFFLRYTPAAQGYIVGVVDQYSDTNTLSGLALGTAADFNNSLLTSIKVFSPGTSERTYRLEVQGNHIRVFVDGIKEIDVVNTAYASGQYVGLWDKDVELVISQFEIFQL